MEKQIAKIRRGLWGSLFVTSGVIGTYALIAYLSYFVVLIMKEDLSGTLSWIGILFFKACGVAITISVLGIVGVPVTIVWLYGVLYARGEETCSFRDFFRDAMITIIK